MIKKNDIVKIITGNDKGKTGKVVRVLPFENKIVVDGVNIRKKHLKPKKSGEKGQIVQMTMPFQISNAMIVCSSCGKTTRIGHKILQNNKKVRGCRRCGMEL